MVIVNGNFVDYVAAAEQHILVYQYNKEFRMKVAVLGAAGGIGRACTTVKTQLPSGSELSV